ncbi:BON domain-containing protein [Rhodanobacter ginsengisoli]|uniref:BON domain-containing protein n=1 Tax=Rhodanobacter ginsengisoli TaxID=418646 RepID=A0ABW0QT12_9GAMM
MRNDSMIRTSLIATAMVVAFATVPLGQAAAQDTGAMQKSSDNRTVPDKAADAWITTKVKSEFGAAKGVSATAISVSTNDGVVTLSGTVKSEREKMKAIRIARKIKGVKSVDAAGLSVAATAPAVPSPSMSGR